jgi:serine/threonine protein kinase
MTDDLHRVREALSDRYAIERELGAGGMATVYLARDIKHARDVAVKVMRPELTAAVGSDRFLREIRITAQLNHPHILSLYDSGESDGLLYYVMPYIAAGSLRVRLKREAPLAVEEALRITTRIASALDHAHSHRVIHRDVKPENILFWEGLPVIADFGIAKAVSEADRDHLTRTGVPVGTPGYMSPEQAMGYTVLDERTDVYSLASVVYEMLIGATPAVWSARDSQRLGRFIDAPPEHRELLNLLPGRIEQALVRALAVAPHDRFPSPGDFAAALEDALESRGVFSDEQVRELLGRAAELQAESPGEGESLTIGAVEQVAADVGIPPEHVREALRQLQGPGAAVPDDAAPLSIARRSERPKFFDSPAGLSKPGKITIDRTLEDEIPPERFEAIVTEIESRLGTVGHVSTLGGTLTWSPAATGPEGRRIVVTLSPLGHLRHKTRIRVTETVELVGWRQAVPAWGGIGGGFLGVLLGAATAEPLAVILSGVLFGVAGVYIARKSTISAIVESRREELQRLSDRLVAIGEGRDRSQRWQLGQ